MVAQKNTNIIIAGVGGQGNRTLMQLLARAALTVHEDVQMQAGTTLGRFGSAITCHVRIGSVASATIPAGEADILLALEMNEAVRALPMLRREALALIYRHCRLPVAAGMRRMHYPSVDEITASAQAREITSIFVPKTLLLPECTSAEQGQSTPYSNSLMLGILCAYTELLPRPLVEQTLCQYLTYRVEQNLAAFASGWQYGAQLRG